MPPAIIAGIAVGVAAFGVGAAIGTAIAIGMAAFSLAYALTLEIPNATPSQQEIKQMLRSSRPPKQVAIGEFYSSGALLFAEEQRGDSENDDGTYNEWLYLAIGVADHPIQQFTNIYFNETNYNEFSGHAVVRVKNDATEVDDFLLRNAPSWKNDMVGKGTTWLAVGMLYDRNLYSNGVPTVRLHGLGHNGLYDPRTRRTNYSNNAAVVIYNFFLLYRNVPHSRLITSGFGSFIDAANLCDETVTNPDNSTSRRYTINGVFTLAEKPAEVLNGMLAACGATLVRIAGRIGILPAAHYGPASFIISESDIISDVSIQPEQSYGENINAVTGTFVDPAQNFNEVEFPPVVDEAAKFRDGNEISVDTKFRFVTDVYQAQRLASITLKRSLAGGLISFKMNLRGLYCVPGRVVTLDMPSLALTGEYRVLNMAAHASEGVDITLAQEDIDLYDDSIGSAYEPPPLTELPDSSTVAAPTGLQFLVEQVGEVVQGYLSWKNRAFKAVKTDVRIKKMSNGHVILVGESTGNTFKINGLLADNYIAEIRSVDNLGRVSVWVSTSFIISKPANVSSVNVKASNWNINLIPVINGGVPAGTLFEFRYLADTASYLTGVSHFNNSHFNLSTLLHTGSSFTHGGLVPDRYHHYWVRAVSVYGKSDWLYVRTGTTRESDLVTTVVERLEAIEIVSSNYVKGSQGYKLHGPNPNNPSEDGRAEFSDIIARGHTEATSGTFSGTLNSTGVLNAAKIYSSEIHGSLIRASTFIESERLFQVEGDLKYPDNSYIIADYYSYVNASLTTGVGLYNFTVWSKFNDIYPYNYTRSKTQRRFRWSTLGDYNRSGWFASFPTFGNQKGSLGITFTLIVEYEDLDGTIKTVQIGAEVSSHLQPFFNNRLWVTPVGNIRFTHINNYANKTCSISWKSESSLHNRHLRRFGVAIGNPYYTGIRQAAVNFYIQARNYEPKP